MTTTNSASFSADRPLPPRIDLRTLVERELSQQWETWAPQHPHLARAIVRMALVEQLVQALHDTPELRAALAQAAVDGQHLATGSRIAQVIQQVVRRALGW